MDVLQAAEHLPPLQTAGIWGRSVCCGLTVCCSHKPRSGWWPSAGTSGAPSAVHSAIGASPPEPGRGSSLLVSLQASLVNAMSVSKESPLLPVEVFLFQISRVFTIEILYKMNLIHLLCLLH